MFIYVAGANKSVPEKYILKGLILCLQVKDKLKFWFLEGNLEGNL